MSESSPSRCHNGRFFFTVRLRDSRADLLVKHIDLLRDVTGMCRQRWSFEIEAAVVLPHMLHMIWCLPPDDLDHAKRWRLIKSTFSRHVPAPAYVASSRKGHHDKGIWQKGHWDHAIRDQQDFDLHMHLVITAPVTAGLVRRPCDWPYSSLARHGRTPLPIAAPELRLVAGAN